MKLIRRSETSDIQEYEVYALWMQAKEDAYDRRLVMIYTNKEKAERQAISLTKLVNYWKYYVTEEALLDGEDVLGA